MCEPKIPVYKISVTFTIKDESIVELLKAAANLVKREDNGYEVKVGSVSTGTGSGSIFTDLLFNKS